MNVRKADWRTYASTLALVLHMQRRMVDMLDAAHTGDADVLLERAGEIASMLRTMVGDFGLDAGSVVLELLATDADEELVLSRHDQIRAIRALCNSLGVSLPHELQEVPC